MKRLFVSVPVAMLLALAFAEIADGGGTGSATMRDAAVARMQAAYERQVHVGEMDVQHVALATPAAPRGTPRPWRAFEPRPSRD